MAPDFIGTLILEFGYRIVGYVWLFVCILAVVAIAVNWIKTIKRKEGH